MLNWLKITALFSFIVYQINGQIINHNSNHRQSGKIEDLLIDDESNIDLEALEFLTGLIDDPIELNSANFNSLVATGILSIEQINHYFNYLKIHGTLLSIYELQAIPSFDIATIHKLLPYVYVDQDKIANQDKPFIKRFFKSENHYLVFRVSTVPESKRGFQLKSDTISSYLGSPYQWLIKYRSSANNDFSFGLTVEKDAGEQIQWDNKIQLDGFDYWSFHLSLKNRGVFKNITLGDYKLQIGQGLMMASGFNPGKSAESITSVKRNHLGISPHTSSVENGYLRGLAATLKYNKLDATLFFSSKLVDGTLNFDSVSNTYALKTIRSTGLHRTVSEKEKYKNVKEQMAGINLTFQSKDNNFQLGQTFMYHRYQFDWSKPVALYKIFDPIEKSYLNIGSHFQFNWQNIVIFGEGFIQQQRNYGYLLGALVNFTARIYGTFLFRKYQPGLLTTYGNGFSEQSGGSNENGFYWGMQFKPAINTILSAYIDIFTFPWVKFGIDRPSHGYEYLLGFSHKLNKKTTIKGQFKVEKKAHNNISTNKPLKSVVTNKKLRYTLQLSYGSDNPLSLKSNIQISELIYGSSYSSGFSISQDLNFNLKNMRLSNRIVLFDTDDSQNRHYRYERDVLYTLSIPSLSGNGFRYYTMLQVKVSNKLSLWIRFARTRFFDRTTIGNGLERIEKPHRSEIKFQMKYAFKE